MLKEIEGSDWSLAEIRMKALRDVHLIESNPFPFNCRPHVTINHAMNTSLTPISLDLQDNSPITLDQF